MYAISKINCSEIENSIYYKGGKIHFCKDNIGVAPHRHQPKKTGHPP
ncbi:hypothetical protein EMIT019CA3_120103 [Bacillus pseudomycoides]